MSNFLPKAWAILLSVNNVMMLKSQRQKQGLTLAEVANSLNAKSVIEYAQYEQGKHLPSLEALAKFLEAIDPELHVSLICYFGIF